MKYTKRVDRNTKREKEKKNVDLDVTCTPVEVMRSNREGKESI